MEIGDYARTKKGDLGKIDNITETLVSIKVEKGISLCTPKENILISSEELFNVLFPGDYINGREGGRIKAKVTDQNGKYFLVGHTGIYYPKDVTSVMTMEKKKILDEMKQEVKDFEKENLYIL